MAKATVSQAMTATPRSIESSESVVQAARLMASEDVGSLPVVEGGLLVGIVTDRDLVLQVLAKDLDPSKVTISEVASENPVVAKPDEPLDAALQRMAQEQVRRLPVVDEGRLVGILAQADVAREARPASTGEMVEQISQEGA
jgi:CBS domain-containing protein